MTVTLVTGWTGGALGETITTATEPGFSVANGSTRVYGAPVGGESGGSMVVSGSGDMAIALGGRPHSRVGFVLKRVSGTQTATCYVADYRSGATLRGNVVLHNTTNNGRLSCRYNTTISATAAPTLTAGTEIYLEVEYEAGVGYSYHFWHTVPAEGAPDESFFIANTNTADALRVGNSGGSSGLTLAFGEVRISDGEQIAPGGGGPTPGTVDFVSNVWADQDTFTVTAKTLDATEITLDIGGGTVADAPDADGYVTLTATGLDAGASHPWALIVDGVERRTGTIDTLPDGSVRFGWGSCFDTATSGVFQLLAARDTAFFAMLGDWGYQYITGGPNGNTSPTDAAAIRAHREPVLRAVAPQGFFTSQPVSYTYSDCDGAGANADGTTGGHAGGAVQAAYRQQFAHPTLPVDGVGARSWTVGRVRFIHTDETAAATLKTATDGPGKSKLGAAQKAWFLGEIDTAAAAGESVVWFGDGPWIEPAGTGGATGNSWAKYQTERAELGNHITASGVKLVRLHGDTHTLFYDDGTNNPWGGFPTASAAPMHTTGQPFGYTVTGGKWPEVTTNSSRQYGVGEITDDGGTLTLTIRGYSSTNTAPTEVERFAAIIDLTPQATRTYANGVPVYAYANGNPL